MHHACSSMYTCALSLQICASTYFLLTSFAHKEWSSLHRGICSGIHPQLHVCLQSHILLHISTPNMHSYIFASINICGYIFKQVYEIRMSTHVPMQLQLQLKSSNMCYTICKKKKKTQHVHHMWNKHGQHICPLAHSVFVCQTLLCIHSQAGEGQPTLKWGVHPTTLQVN